MKKIVNWFVGASVMLNAIMIIMIASSCGGRNDGGYADGGDEQGPPPDDTDGGGSDDWGAIKTVIDGACGKCHNGTNQKAFDSEQRFRSSKALARLEAGTMPPGGKIDPTAKAKLIGYLKR